MVADAGGSSAIIPDGRAKDHGHRCGHRLTAAAQHAREATQLLALGYDLPTLPVVLLLPVVLFLPPVDLFLA